jgi:hypothetical protein
MLRALIALFLILGACNSGPVLLRDKKEVPEEIRSACAVAEVRCSKCHPIERLKLARVDKPEHWRLYVNRMRRQPASGISEGDAKTILSCLKFLTFGKEAK